MRTCLNWEVQCHLLEGDVCSILDDFVAVGDIRGDLLFGLERWLGLAVTYLLTSTCCGCSFWKATFWPSQQWDHSQNGFEGSVFKDVTVI